MKAEYAGKAAKQVEDRQLYGNIFSSHGGVCGEKKLRLKVNREKIVTAYSRKEYWRIASRLLKPAA